MVGISPEGVIGQVRDGEMDLKEARKLIRLFKQDEVRFRIEGGMDERTARKEVSAKYAEIDGKLRAAAGEGKLQEAARASRFVSMDKKRRAGGIGACMPRMHREVMREILGNGR